MDRSAALEKRDGSGAAATLTPAAAALARASISENTRRAYQSALDRLQAFLREQGRDLAPLTDRQLAGYLGARHEAGAAPASASLAVAAVRFLAKTTGQPSPAGPLTGRVMAGIRRQGKDRGRGQVAGIQWSQADTAAALASNGDGDLAGLRDAALMALMSDGLLRAGEATALRAEHLALEEDGTGRLTLEHSKTDQEGVGAVLFVGAPTARRLRAWMRAAGIESGPLFRRVRRGGVIGDGAALHPGRPPDHQAPGRRRRLAGLFFRPLSAGRVRSVPRRPGRVAGGDADRRTLAVSGHARPLRPGGVCRPGSRRPAPVWEVSTHGGTEQ